MDLLISYYVGRLDNKYYRIITNRWFWMVFALLVLASSVSYAFYCTSRVYSFTGNIRLKWPKIWQMGIGCKR